MSRFQSHLCQTVILAAVVTFALSGCSKAAPQETSQEVLPAGQAVTSPENAASTAPSTITPTSSVIPATTIVPKASSSIDIGKEIPSTSIGPGHFNGHHETVISRVAEIRTFCLSPNGQFLAVGRQLNRNSGVLQLWEVSSAKLIRETFEPWGLTAVTFAADSQTLAYGAGDHSIVLQASTNGTARRLKRHSQSIRDLAFSPDGRSLASLGLDKRLIVWDVSSATVTSEWINDRPNMAWRVQFADGDRLWTWSDNGELRWFQLQSKSLVPEKELKLSEGLWPVVAVGQEVYGLGPDRTIRIVDVTTGKIRSGPTLGSPPIASIESHISGQPAPAITAVVVAKTSHDLAVVTTDGKLTLWKEGHPESKKDWNIGVASVRGVATDDRGKVWVAHTSDGSLAVLDKAQPDSMRWLESPTHGTPDSSFLMRFSNSGETVVSFRTPQKVVVSQLKTAVTRREIMRDATGDVNRVTAVLLADDNTVICGTTSGVLEVWKNEANKASFIPIGKSKITALAATPDGTSLMIGDTNGATIWLDIRQQKPSIPQREHTAAINSADISPDGRMAATVGDDRLIVIWDVARQQRLRVLRGHEHPIRAVNFSLDNKWLVSGDQLGNVIVWDVATGTQTWSTVVDRSQPISAVAFSPDQRVVAAGTTAGYTQTFNFKHRQRLSTVFHQAHVTDLTFTADDTSLLVATSLGNVTRWWQAPSVPKFMTGHQGSVRFAALDASGQRAVTGGHDKRLCVWDVDQATLKYSLDNEGEAITSGALSPAGHRAVTGSFGSGVVFWDLISAKRLAKRYGHKKRVQSLAISADGNIVASGSDDHTVRIWDFASQQTKRTITLDAPVHFIAFSPDGRQLLTTTIDPRGWQLPGRQQLWETATGKLVLELKDHAAVVNAAVFSSDGRELTSCGADGQLCRWTVATGEQLHDSYRPDGLSHAGLIRNDALLVLRRFNKGVFIYDLGSMSPVAEFDVPTRAVTDLHVAPLGNRIIAGTEEGPVYVWSLGDD